MLHRKLLTDAVELRGETRDNTAALLAMLLIQVLQAAFAHVEVAALLLECADMRTELLLLLKKQLRAHMSLRF